MTREKLIRAAEWAVLLLFGGALFAIFMFSALAPDASRDSMSLEAAEDVRALEISDFRECMEREAPAIGEAEAVEYCRE